MQNPQRPRVRPFDTILGRIAWILMRVVALLPLSYSQAIGRWIGRSNYWLNTRAAKVTATNIRFCLPDLPLETQHRLARESLVQTGQMLMECPATWLGSINRVHGWIRETRGESLVNAAVASAQGLLIIVPHMGNWELINVHGAWRSRELGDDNLTILYAPPSKAYMRNIMAEVRGRFGNQMVPTTTGGLARVYKTLEEGGTAVILPDQVPARGEFVPFFGHDCLTDRLVSRLIKRTHPRVVCCVFERLASGEGFRVVFSEPDPDIYSDDQVVSLRGLNRSVEQCVHQALPQYQWEYKRFRKRPAGKLRIYNYKNKPLTHH